ncbi:MAG: hypothetical protein EA390_05025 [Balneolaceae bacterium]|nr:MAG: hypothetical protein EA390_05025 [Balneolaceae bacterium]
MSTSELSESNYRRICFINWALSVPLLLIFSWPYFFLCQLLEIQRFVAFAGAILFALPFMLTILHGHVTMALGVVHRHHYYEWLQGYPFTYGVLFHPMIISTRFRLILFFVSLGVLAAGYLW